MRRRGFLVGGAASLAASRAVFAQPLPASPGDLPRVGVLTPQASTEPASLQREPFELGLRELGWLPGSNIFVEYRYAEGEPERLRALADALVQQKVRLIISRGEQATDAARRAAKGTIAIVMAVTADPVGSGFVTSLARPGGNITGLTFLAAGPTEAKQLELLAETVPSLRRVAVLTNPLVAPAHNAAVERALSSAAASLSLVVEIFEIRAASALTETLSIIGRGNFGALLVRPDPHNFERHRDQVLVLAHQNRLPAIYSWGFYVREGGLMSYGASLADLHRRSATYVDKILKGASPSELPVEQPTMFELIVNLSTARALRLDFPPAVLARADEVIE